MIEKKCSNCRYLAEQPSAWVDEKDLYYCNKGNLCFRVIDINKANCLTQESFIPKDELLVKEYKKASNYHE